MPAYETHKFKNAALFVQRLRLSHSGWLRSDGKTSPYIFRGESKDGRTLLPSSCRSLDKDNTYRRYVELNFRSEVDGLAKSNIGRSSNKTENHVLQIKELAIQAVFEHKVVFEFVKLMNELGLFLPGGLLESSLHPNTDITIRDELYYNPAVALAQHHGIPTSLLDWTLNPLKAAFFAGEKSKKGGPPIVIWALNTDLVTGGYCKVFTIPRNFAGYLHAQEGIFTYDPEMADRFFNKGVSKGSWKPLDELHTLEHGVLTKLTLDQSEVPNLMKILWAERITKAHLMPTHDNIASVLKEEWEHSIAAAESKPEN